MDKQTEMIRQMTPERKLEVSMQLYWSARDLKEAAIRHFHPDWPEEKVRQAVREAFLYARS